MKKLEKYILSVLTTSMFLIGQAVYATERSTVETLVAAYSAAATAAAGGDYTQAREAFQNAQALRKFNSEALRSGGLVADREMTLADTTAERVLVEFDHPSASLVSQLDKLQRHMETLFATLPSPPPTNSAEAIKQVRQQFDAAMIELTEREFPNALEFVSRGATAIDANRKLLGSDSDVSRLSTSVESARTALKNQQFRVARRSLDNILSYLNR